MEANDEKYTLIAALLVLLLGPLLTPALAQLVVVSPGCERLNNTDLDGFASAVSITQSLEFFAGEQIMVTAGEPDQFDPTEIQLRLDSTTMATTPYPGTLTYEVPAATTVSSLSFGVISGNATLDISCAPPANEPPVCEAAYPSTDTLWSPNQQMVSVSIMGGMMLVNGIANLACHSF